MPTSAIHEAVEEEMRARKQAHLAGGLIVLMFLTGACSSGSSKATPAASTPASMANLVALAQCMRANGVPNFPDPKPGEGIKLPPGLDRNSPAAKKAEAACEKYRPEQPDEDPKKDSWPQADKLKYAQCMRTNGVPRFPDPKADGSLQFDKASGIDPKSAQFKKAQQACDKYKSEEARNAPKMKEGPN
jgi:hypothetical protein